MPSDPRVTRALASLERPIARYRAAVAATLEDIRGYLAAGRSSSAASAERLRGQLGPFAGGRVDAGRLAAMLGDRDGLDDAALGRLERASDTLRSLASHSDSLLHADVPPGGSLEACVAGLLATIGRAFAAARIAAAARGGREAPGMPGRDEDLALYSFPFGEWNAAERAMAPPLVITVPGADLTAGALAPFLDGAAKLLLIVEGPSAPAPLVRLITPGVLVMQAHDQPELDLLADWSGAAIGALVPAGAARFLHDPSAGREPWQRLTMHIDETAQIGRVGGLTAAQQKEELHQLRTLAARPAVRPGAADGAPAAASEDPAGRLAAWLLQQAGASPDPPARDA